jgi:hypothetical protein
VADAVIEFAAPAGFWLALAALGVLAAHLIRRRARRQVVPFLPLWSAVAAQRRGGFGAALVRRLDLLLVLLACALVAGAAGVPLLPGVPSSVRDLVLVIDGDVTARAGARDRRLRQLAAAEIHRRAPGTRFVVISVTDDGAAVWSGTEAAGALAAVRSHRPGWTPAPREPAVALAREAARGLREADVVLCTHRPGRPEGVRLRTLVEQVKNAGFASLEVIGDPEGGGFLARAGLRGDGPVEIGGLWKGEVDGTRVVTVPLPAAGRVVLTARASDDAFAPDDSVFLELPEKTVPRVLVVADGEPSPFLTAALQALEATGAIRGPLDRAPPARALDARSVYDVMVFDRCAPPEQAAGLRALYLAPPPGALPFRVGEPGAAPLLFDVVRDHPVLQGLDLGRVAPLRARAVFGGDVLASAAPGPVLAVAPAWIALGFDPDGCVFAASPAYPLFLRNCIRHLADAAPAAGALFHAVGDPAPVSGVATVEGHGSWRVGERLLGPPGFWEIGDETLAVNLLWPGLDLNPPGDESDPLPPVGDPGRPDRPLAPEFAAAGLAALLLAWWLFWR